MRIPATEALFPEPWTVAARRVLPSPSPQLTATAMWGPILAWCALELLAESIDIQNPERVALDLFDRLRLREPFAQSFAALGFEGEEHWRVAARIKVVLLTGAGVGKPGDAPLQSGKNEEPVTQAVENSASPDSSRKKKPDASNSQQWDDELSRSEDEKVALAPALWLDPDVRWLTGVHEAEGHLYLVREQYEELLWWLLMPSLLRLAAEPAPSRAAVEELSKTVDEALVTAEVAGYRIDAFFSPASASLSGEVESPVLEDNSPAIEQPTQQKSERESKQSTAKTKSPRRSKR